MNMPFMGKCAIYGQMCHLWANVPFFGKCDIYGQIWHLWANVTFMDKCDIYGQMCHLRANVPFMEKCAIYGKMWHLWANAESKIPSVIAISLKLIISNSTLIIRTPFHCHKFPHLLSCFWEKKIEKGLAGIRTRDLQVWRWI